MQLYDAPLFNPVTTIGLLVPVALFEPLVDEHFAVKLVAEPEPGTNVTLIWPISGVRPEMTGAEGFPVGTAGVTLTVPEAKLAPTELLALTLQVEVLALVSPVTVIGLVVPVAVTAADVPVTQDAV